MDLAALIPIVTAGIIAVATLAIIPILKTMGEIKKQTDEIHKVVNSNFQKATEDLRVANERIGTLIKSVEQSDQRLQDLLLVIKNNNVDPRFTERTPPKS